MKKYGIFRKIHRKYPRKRVENESKRENSAEEKGQASSFSRWAYLTVIAEHKKKSGGR